MTKTATQPARRFARMPAEVAAPAANPASRSQSKIALVTRLLERNEGASLDELVTATG